uniref:Uncharacterized protein n=1 Tax=Oryza punctata TaxID=4537 RepID=A0A0E0MM27_ORYPU
MERNNGIPGGWHGGSGFGGGYADAVQRAIEETAAVIDFAGREGVSGGEMEVVALVEGGAGAGGMTRSRRSQGGGGACELRGWGSSTEQSSGSISLGFEGYWSGNPTFPDLTEWTFKQARDFPPWWWLPLQG